jgi:hypothetical protein
MSGDAAPYVQLFQKAHQRIVMLERLDEQVNQILSKRQELQDELRSIQAQLNEEFEARIKLANGEQASVQMPRPVVTIAPEAKRGSGVRFAAQQSIDVPERAVG